MSDNSKERSTSESPCLSSDFHQLTPVRALRASAGKKRHRLGARMKAGADPFILLSLHKEPSNPQHLQSLLDSKRFRLGMISLK
jgi:hypothetical protein